jgi:putative ABC transport system permease protein
MIGGNPIISGSVQTPMATVLQDLRFALRGLSRNRSFTVVAVAALAFGIGADSAIFSVIYSVLLKPLRTATLQRSFASTSTTRSSASTNSPFSPADFLDYRRPNSVFQDIDTYVRQDQQYGGDHPARLTGVRVSYRFFTLLGVEPMLGRGFTHEEESTCCATDVVVVCYNVWKRLMGGDPHAIGKTLRLTDSGVLIEQAQAEMNVIASRLAAQYPDDGDWRIQLRPLQDDLVASARPTLLILAGAVGFVLLIAGSAASVLSAAAAKSELRNLRRLAH